MKNNQSTITHCTLTGVDEQTDLAKIAELSKLYPFVEWGFLYSPKNEGQPGRYPSVEFLREAFMKLPNHIRVALHVCGRGVPDLIRGEPVVTELVQLIDQRSGRVQLNFSARSLDDAFTLEELHQYIERYPDNVEFITQNNGVNFEVYQYLKDLPNHAILFDASGGRGIEADVWLPPFNGVRCGYAGGLGPANVAAELKKITAATEGLPFWIDMESKLRSASDQFDLSACEEVLEKVEEVLNDEDQDDEDAFLDNLCPRIFPVIHYLDRKTAFEEAKKAFDAKADGIFLISHQGNDKELVSVACAIQIKFPTLPVGVNFLSMRGVDATVTAHEFGLPMVWGDDMGVDSQGLNAKGRSIKGEKLAQGHGLEIFASVAFKYRPHEPNPELAAKNALDAGFIPTTSGSGTGSAPEIEKIIAMSKATGGILAIASGMTPENVGEFAPYLSHILVATGIAQDEHRMDVSKLKSLIANSKSSRSKKYSHTHGVHETA